MNNDKKKINILALELNDLVKNFVCSQLKNYSLTEVKSSYSFLENIENWKNDDFDLILCGGGWDDLPIIEIGQSVRMKFKKKSIFFIGLDSEVKENSELVKNGFEDSYYFPMDANFLSIALHNLEMKITGESFDRLVAVNITDFKPDEAIDFELNLFMPVNQKYIKINNQGQPLAKKTAERFNSYSIGQLYIKESNLNKYYSYLTSKIKELKPNSPEIKKSIRRLFHDILSPKSAIFEEGKTYMGYANEIVMQYIKSPDVLNIQKELLSNLGSENDGLYERSQKIATIAGMISLATGRGKPEDLVTAALFCDMGLSEIPLDIRNKKESDLSKEEKDHFYKHIAKTMNILGNKRIVLVPEVRDAIQDHHERFDGKGYPANKPGFKLSDEAQILSFAVQFEELTRVITGQPRIFPENAFHQISKNGSINPELIIVIKPLFINSQSDSIKNNKAS